MHISHKIIQNETAVGLTRDNKYFTMITCQSSCRLHTLQDKSIILFNLSHNTGPPSMVYLIRAGIQFMVLSRMMKSGYDEIRFHHVIDDHEWYKWYECPPCPQWSIYPTWSTWVTCPQCSQCSICNTCYRCPSCEI